MSVPLVGVATPLPQTTIPTILRTHPTATYERQECFCGCCQFDEL